MPTHGELTKAATVFRYWGETPVDIKTRCIFCRIASGAAKPGVNESASLLRQSPDAVAFADIAPAAAGHVLVIPRTHIKNWREFEPSNEHASLVKEMLVMGQAALRDLGHGAAVESGQYRAGFIRPPWNSVHHVHMHVMTKPFGADVGWVHRLGFSSSLFFVSADQVVRELECGAKARRNRL